MHTHKGMSKPCTRNWRSLVFKRNEQSRGKITTSPWRNTFKRCIQPLYGGWTAVWKRAVCFYVGSCICSEGNWELIPGQKKGVTVFPAASLDSVTLTGKLGVFTADTAELTQNQSVSFSLNSSRRFFQHLTYSSMLPSPPVHLFIF